MMQSIYFHNFFIGFARFVSLQWFRKVIVVLSPQFPHWILDAIRLNSMGYQEYLIISNLLIMKLVALPLFLSNTLPRPT